MKKYFSLLIFALTLSACVAQVKPSDFILEPNPGQSNFEVYSQYNGVNRRASMDGLRKYFGAQINATTLGYIPTLTGNTTDINRFVTGSNNRRYFIDQFGASIDFPDFYTVNGTFTSNRTVNANAYTFTFSNLGNSTYAPASNATTNFRWFVGNGTGYTNGSGGQTLLTNMQLQGANSLLGNYLRVDCYSDQRNDTGLPASIASWDAFGKLERHPVDELLTALDIPDLTFNQGLNKISDVVGLGGDISNVWFQSETTDVGAVFTPPSYGNLVGGVNFKPLMFETHTFDNDIAEEHGVKIPFVQTDESNTPHENYLYSSMKSLDIVAEQSLLLRGNLSQGIFTSQAASGLVQLSATCADCTVNNIVSIEQTPAALGTVKLSTYKNTRDDSGTPVNMFSSTAQGVLQSHSVADLKTPLGLDSGVFSATSSVGSITLRYQKSGDVVFCYYGFTANIAASSTGAGVTVTSLPFTPAANFAAEFDATGSGTFQGRSGSTNNGYSAPVNVRAVTGTKNVYVETISNIATTGANSYFVGSFSYKIQ